MYVWRSTRIFSFSRPAFSLRSSGKAAVVLGSQINQLKTSIQRLVPDGEQVCVCAFACVFVPPINGAILMTE